MEGVLITVGLGIAIFLFSRLSPRGEMNRKEATVARYRALVREAYDRKELSHETAYVIYDFEMGSSPEIMLRLLGDNVTFYERKARETQQQQDKDDAKTMREIYRKLSRFVDKEVPPAIGAKKSRAER